jgi:hypothetical protein
MTFGDEYTVSCVHTPHNAGAGVSSGITGQQSEGKGMTERKSVVSQPISEGYKLYFNHNSEKKIYYIKIYKTIFYKQLNTKTITINIKTI